MDGQERDIGALVGGALDLVVPFVVTFPVLSVVAYVGLQRGYVRSIRKLMASRGGATVAAVSSVAPPRGSARIEVRSMRPGDHPTIAAVDEGIARGRARRLTVAGAIALTVVLGTTFMQLFVEPDARGGHSLTAASIVVGTLIFLAPVAVLLAFRWAPVWTLPAMAFSFPVTAGIAVSTASLLAPVGNRSPLFACCCAIANVLVTYPFGVVALGLVLATRSAEAVLAGSDALRADARLVILSSAAISLVFGMKVAVMLLGAGTLLFILAALAVRPPRDPERPLVLLRTFGYAKRSRVLLERLAAIWLERGPVDLIAGPDLAERPTSVASIFSWLTLRLRRRFVTSPQDAHARLEAHAGRRGGDRVYPIRELACLDDAWRSVVESLVVRPNVACVMDLRAFRRGNRGCVDELAMLARARVLGRAVLLVDNSTDVEALIDELRGTGWNDDLVLWRMARADGATARTIAHLAAALAG